MSGKPPTQKQERPLGWKADVEFDYQDRMDCFDLRSSPSPRFRETPPLGYAAGWVRISELDETILFCTKIWSPSDYAQHWKSTAQLLLQEGMGLFCTDLTEESASIFVGFSVGGAFEFEELVAPRHMLILDGLQLKIARYDRSDRTSCWRVSADAIRAFALT